MSISTLPPEKQLDFWIGEWDVSWGEDNHGYNSVKRILDDKVVQESFNGNPASPLVGISLSVYSEKLNLWQQTWVDNQGSCWNFVGGAEDERMILGTDDVIDGNPVKLRMVFFDIQENAFKWNWERSDDGGETWTVQWQTHYRRKTAP